MLDAWPMHRLGGEHPIYLCCAANSTRVQLTAEASFLSFLSVTVAFILVGVCLAHFLGPVRPDSTLRRGTYVVIRRNSQMVAGGFSAFLLTYTWSA
jgi:hypothetical protein